MALHTFDSWLNNKSTTESEEVQTAISTNNIHGDVDTIITSLETLAKELTEELETEDDSIDEGVVDFMKAWYFGTKAANSQEKVNKIKMNAADLEFAAEKAPGEKGKSLGTKSKAANKQADQLQDMVDDRFEGKGNYVDARLHKTKIKGQIAIIKRTTGMEDDPGKKANLKTKMKELANKYKEEESIVAKFEDDNKEEIAKAKAKADKPAADKAAADKAAADKAAEDKAAADELAQNQNPPNTPQNQDPPNTPKTAPKQPLGIDDADDKTKDEREKKNNKEGMLARWEKLLKSAEESGDEAKIKRAKDKIATISAMEAWQIDGTELGRMFEMELTKFENEIILNESKYLNLSIKERFARLL